jgi:hypothetical protein
MTNDRQTRENSEHDDILEVTANELDLISGGKCATTPAGNHYCEIPGTDITIFWGNGASGATSPSYGYTLLNL